jgi:outer membrane lipoprotein SlyB
MIVSPEERARLDSQRTRALRTAGTAAASRAPTYRSSTGDVARPSTARTGSRVVKHTQRDAVIGAAAGAIIGGATHGGKGAVIGGATGAALGAIIGNNVDKKKKKP